MKEKIPQTRTEKILILMRGLSSGHKIVLEAPNGDYISEQLYGTSLVPVDSIEKTIDSRLQYELYGEYPLSGFNLADWKRNVKPSFKGL